MSTRLLGQTAASPAPWGRSPPGAARRSSGSAGQFGGAAADLGLVSKPSSG